MRSGLVLDGPYIAIDPTSQPNPLTVFAGKIVAPFIPKRQVKQKMEPGFISRDPAVCSARLEDEFCHETGTLEGLRDV